MYTAEALARKNAEERSAKNSETNSTVLAENVSLAQQVGDLSEENKILKTRIAELMARNESVQACKDSEDGMKTEESSVINSSENKHLTATAASTAGKQKLPTSAAVGERNNKADAFDALCERIRIQRQLLIESEEDDS